MPATATAGASPRPTACLRKHAKNDTKGHPWNPAAQTWWDWVFQSLGFRMPNIYHAFMTDMF